MGQGNTADNSVVPSLIQLRNDLDALVARLDATHVQGGEDRPTGRFARLNPLRAAIVVGIVLCCAVGAYLLPSTGAYPEPEFSTGIDLWTDYEQPLPENAYVNVVISPNADRTHVSIEAPFAKEISIAYYGVGPFPDTPESDIYVDPSRAQLAARSEGDAPGWTVVAKDGRTNMAREPEEQNLPNFEEDVCHNWADPQVWVGLSPRAIGSISDGRLTQSVPGIRVIGPKSGTVKMRVLVCPLADFVIDATDRPPQRAETGWWLWEQEKTASKDEILELDVGTIRAHSLSRVDADARRSVFSGAFFGLAGGLALLLPATSARGPQAPPHPRRGGLKGATQMRATRNGPRRSDGDDEAARPDEATMLVHDAESIVASAPRDRGDEEADRNRWALDEAGLTQTKAVARGRSVHSPTSPCDDAVGSSQSTTSSMRRVGAVAFALLVVGTVSTLFRRRRPEE